MSTPDKTARTTDRLTELLTGPLQGLGLDLEAVDLTRAGKRSVLRVAVDKDGGVDLDDIAEATREISELLDASDAMGEAPYTLEVSSRGVDRPLTLPRHWRRNAGRLVEVALVDGEADGKAEGEPILGRIREADETGAVIAVGDEDTRVEFDQVSRARIQIEFKRED